MGKASGSVFDSPWYQIAPLIGNGVSGAIIALYKPAGFQESGSGCQGNFGIGFPAAFAASISCCSFFCSSRLVGSSSISLARHANTGINEAFAESASRLVHASAG